METKDIKKFAQIEKDMALFERSYNGIFYWQYIRFYVCEMCYTNSLAVQQNRLKEASIISLAKGLFKSVYIIIREYFFWLRPHKFDLIVIRNEKFKDRFFEGWQLPEEINFMTFRRDSFNDNYNKNEHYFELPRLKDNVNKKWWQITRRYPLDKSEDEFLKKLEILLKKEFGKSPSFEGMKQRIYDCISKEKYYPDYYSKLLKKTDCKAILCVVYYNTKFYSLFRLAKQKGVKIIELQHGVINNHESYWFEDNRGVNNYTPDILLTFGDVHNSWIKLVEGSEPVAIGAPYQEGLIKRECDIVPDAKIVMVYPVAEKEFEKVINDFEKIASPNGYQIMIKLHPQQASKFNHYYPILSVNPNIKVITSQTEGIYHWLKVAKHHVMASTTVGLEALQFDHVNICVALNVKHDQTQCLIDWGVARGFSTASELYDLIRAPIVFDQRLNNIRDRLWKKSAKNNMEKFFYEMYIHDWSLN